MGKHLAEGDLDSVRVSTRSLMVASIKNKKYMSEEHLRSDISAETAVRMSLYQDRKELELMCKLSDRSQERTKIMYDLMMHLTAGVEQHIKHSYCRYIGGGGGHTIDSRSDTDSYTID